MQDSTEINAWQGFLSLIKREVDRRVRPFEDLLKSTRVGKSTPAEEYLDLDELARRTHTAPKTIRDWVHKRKIHFQKLPTGGIRFPWSKVEAWMKGGES